MQINQIEDYIRFTTIIKKYDIGQDIVFSMENPYKLIELDEILAEEKNQKIRNIISKCRTIKTLIIIDFQYIERLENLIGFLI